MPDEWASRRALELRVDCTREWFFLLLGVRWNVSGWRQRMWILKCGVCWGSFFASAFLVRELSLRELNWKSCANVAGFPDQPSEPFILMEEYSEEIY